MLYIYLDIDDWIYYLIPNLNFDPTLSFTVIFLKIFTVMAMGEGGAVWRVETVSIINLLLKEKYSRPESEECEGIENISLFLSANFYFTIKRKFNVFLPS